MRRLLISLLAVTAHAQSLRGVIDFHVHAGPDSVARSIDAVELARIAKERGMRAIVLKSHWEPTASMAYLVRKAVPGIGVFGGIDLNRSVGGVNATAVERMASVQGGWGRVVWMPTFDAENQVRYSKENRPFVAVSKGGELLPEVKEVIAVVARRRLTLETGHSSPAECLALIREARRQGVDRIVVTHAMLAPVGMSIAEMQAAAKDGAFLEFVYGAVAGSGKAFELSDYVKAIREVGSRSVILASDLGQAGNPLHPDGLEAFFRGLRASGFTQAEIDLMSKTNPAKALGLD